MLARAEMERIAARLAVLGHGAGAMRLRIGEGLLRLDAVGGVKALGFPNLEAYCREALGRSGRFGSDVRALARRLSNLPELRAALITGRLKASMVELVARVATPLDEAEWVERAATMNVRAMRAELMRRRLEVMDDEAPERTTIAMTVPRDEAWAFERAKMMVEAVGGVRGDEAIEAMLAEGLTEILARVPDFDLPWNLTAAAQDEIVEARRVRAEQRAEREAQESSAARFVGTPHHVAVGSGGEPDVVWPATLIEIDARLRTLGRELAGRDMEMATLGRLADEHAIWWHLGYASFDHFHPAQVPGILVAFFLRSATRRSVQNATPSNLIGGGIAGMGSAWRRA